MKKRTPTESLEKKRKLKRNVDEGAVEFDFNLFVAKVGLSYQRMIHQKTDRSNSVATVHDCREIKSNDENLLIRRKNSRRRCIPFRPSPGLFKELTSQRIPKMSPVKFRYKIEDQSTPRPVAHRSNGSSCFNSYRTDDGHFSTIS